ncbi:MAG: hypothetical protein ABSD68_04035 [Candidatus Micrarchaeales archaeon]|jgi:hypothetical protein
MNKMKPYLKFIILILVLLIGVYFLYILNNRYIGDNSIQGTACVADSGYYCANHVYSHVTGNLTFAFRQDTQTIWTSWAIAYAHQGMTFNVTTGAPYALFLIVPNSPSLPSGQNVSITLPISSPDTQIGTPIEGAIYACYTTAKGVTGMLVSTGICVPYGNMNATVKYVQVATFTARAS